MNAGTAVFKGNVVDVVNGRIFPGTVRIENGRITSVTEEPVDETHFLLPGLIDAHIHIESSMLIPSEFARLAVTHGTVATVSDPHEIANVLGIPGVRFMIENGARVPFKFFFGAPSCVPATNFETAGAVLGIDATEELLQMPEIHYLSEMMNFPGVLFRDEEVMAKLSLAKKYHKPVDGHAPGLRGEAARQYAEAGISTDHECFTLGEAVEKAGLGMSILIREGSAARNFDELAPLLRMFPDQVMFCSDDRHPDDLVRRHIDDVVRRALAMGYDPVTVIRACTLNPVRHYGLDVGLLQEGDPADFIIAGDLADFNVQEVYIEGRMVSRLGKTLIGSIPEKPVNLFRALNIVPADLLVPRRGDVIKVIEAAEGQLVTHALHEQVAANDDMVESDVKNDVLKMAVINRYNPAPPALAFARGFGLKRGALASTVAHDSHNIICIGTTDEEMVLAINALVKSKGGICCVDGEMIWHLPLPVAGLMSSEDGFKVAGEYEAIDFRAKELGSRLRSPFMTLSFMALLVIPALKLSDKGLFDGDTFGLTTLFLDQI